MAEINIYVYPNIDQFISYGATMGCENSFYVYPDLSKFYSYSDEICIPPCSIWNFDEAIWNLDNELWNCVN